MQPDHAPVSDVPADTAGRLVLASRLLHEAGHRTLANALLVDSIAVSMLPQIFAPDHGRAPSSPGEARSPLSLVPTSFPGGDGGEDDPYSRKV
jgi:hypothetical protein